MAVAALRARLQGRPEKPQRRSTYTPFPANITRGDGQQELKGIDVTLPPGATAKLAGVPYCPPTALAAAAAQAGAAEKANAELPRQKPDRRRHDRRRQRHLAARRSPARPTSPAPTRARRSRWRSITPALAGPFDLGTVVVRVPLFVDPETAQIHVVSDAIPDVFGGAKLDIRSIAVNVNKDGFTLNGTNCSKFATAGALKGGGADPTNPAAFSSFPVSDPVQLNNCDAARLPARS